MIWRLIGGLAIGAASVIAPTYIAEIAPARMRGRLGSLQQLAIVFGIFVALLSDYALATAAGGPASNELWCGLEAWRWMFLVGVDPGRGVRPARADDPGVAPLAGARGRHGAGPGGARPGRGRGVDIDAAIEEITSSVTSDRPAALSDLRGPRLGLLPIVWVGILLSVFQQFVGINVIFYYSSTLWQAVGFSEDDALLTGVLNSTVNIVGHVHRDRARRPRRTPAAAADRFARHVRLARRDDLGLRHRDDRLLRQPGARPAPPARSH